MPAPHRHHSRRPQPPRQAPVLPLARIVTDYETWRQSQNGRPGRGALRDYWRAQDGKHGMRADYQLWRHTLCPESPPEKRQDVAALVMQALRHGEGEARGDTLAMAAGWLLKGQPPEVVQRLRPALVGEMKRLVPAVRCHELTGWLLSVALKEEPVLLLSRLRDWGMKLDPSWKPGRRLPLTAALEPGGLIPAMLFHEWLVAGLRAVLTQRLEAVAESADVDEMAAWQVTLWSLLRDLRAPQSPVRYAEIEALLEAAATARCAGQGIEAARWASLALHLLPEKAPAALRQRCQVAAWSLAELGLAVPAGGAISLDELPFPGEPATSEKGQEAARLFRDDADRFQKRLNTSVEADEDWQKLRAAGVVLNHPLAALAWVGKKAQAAALKKQYDLLRAAAHLAARHGALGTLSRLRAEFVESPESVLELAQCLREAQRRLPFFRDEVEWQRQAQCLRVAWGRVDGDLPGQDEALFFMHETLLDREVTLMRGLPEEVRTLALKHLHTRRMPTALVQHLEQQPKHFQCLEHQRTVELWSIASECRERPELNGVIWISMVLRGEPSSGKYSWIVQSAAGRERKLGRVKCPPGGGPDYTSLHEEVAAAARTLCPEGRAIILAVSPELEKGGWQGLFPGVPVMLVPSWEWAFRTLRDAGKGEASRLQSLRLDTLNATACPALPSPVTGSLGEVAVLWPGDSIVDASSRWLSLEEPESAPLRSLAIGANRLVICLGQVAEGRLRDDLRHLALAQRGRGFLSARRALSPAESALALQVLLSSGHEVSLLERTRALILQQPDLWCLSGVLW